MNEREKTIRMYFMVASKLSNEPRYPDETTLRLTLEALEEDDETNCIEDDAVSMTMSYLAMRHT